MTFAVKNLTQPEIITTPNIHTPPHQVLFLTLFHFICLPPFPWRWVPSCPPLLALFTDLPSHSLAVFFGYAFLLLTNAPFSALISLEQSPHILPWTTGPFLWSLIYLRSISFCTFITVYAVLVNRAFAHFAFCWKWLSLPSCKFLLFLWDTSFFGKAFLISTIQAKLYASVSFLL